MKIKGFSFDPSIVTDERNAGIGKLTLDGIHRDDAARIIAEFCGIIGRDMKVQMTVNVAEGADPDRIASTVAAVAKPFVEKTPEEKADIVVNAKEEKKPEPAPEPEAPKQEEPKKGWDLSGKGSSHDDDGTPKTNGSNAASLDGLDIEALKGTHKFADILTKLLDTKDKAGEPMFKSIASITKVCEDLKAQVPTLSRVTNLGERIERTLKVLEKGDLPAT